MTLRTSSASGPNQNASTSAGVVLAIEGNEDDANDPLLCKARHTTSLLFGQTSLEVVALKVRSARAFQAVKADRDAASIQEMRAARGLAGGNQSPTCSVDHFRELSVSVG